MSLSFSFLFVLFCLFFFCFLHLFIYLYKGSLSVASNCQLCGAANKKTNSRHCMYSSQILVTPLCHQAHPHPRAPTCQVVPSPSLLILPCIRAHKEGVVFRKQNFTVRGILLYLAREHSLLGIYVYFPLVSL
jgi:hypothetical protein